MMKFTLILLAFFLLECSQAKDKKTTTSPIPNEWDMNSDWSNFELSVKDL